MSIGLSEMPRVGNRSITTVNINGITFGSPKKDRKNIFVGTLIGTSLDTTVVTTERSTKSSLK